MGSGGEDELVRFAGRRLSRMVYGRARERGNLRSLVRVILRDVVVTREHRCLSRDRSINGGNGKFEPNSACKRKQGLAFHVPHSECNGFRPRVLTVLHGRRSRVRQLTKALCTGNLARRRMNSIFGSVCKRRCDGTDVSEVLSCLHGSIKR